MVDPWILHIESVSSPRDLGRLGPGFSMRFLGSSAHGGYQGPWVSGSKMVGFPSIKHMGSIWGGSINIINMGYFEMDGFFQCSKNGKPIWMSMDDLGGSPILGKPQSYGFSNEERIVSWPNQKKGLNGKTAIFQEMWNVSPSKIGGFWAFKNIKT